MKKSLALFAAAALCASAQTPAAAPDAEAAPAPAPAPDVTLRVKSLDAVREAVTAFTTLVGRPQYGLMGSMGLTSALSEAGLSDLRPADPAYAWVWGVADLVASDADEPPPFLVAIPVATPSEAVLDDAFERVASDDPSAPAVWSLEDEVFVTVAANHLLAASSVELFGRAKALLAAPAALPEATFSVSSDNLQSFLPPLLDLVAAEQAGDLSVAGLPGDAPSWAEPVLHFVTEMNRVNMDRLRDLESFRFGFRCDLANGLLAATAMKAAPGTGLAAAFDGLKTPLAPDALAGIPSGSFLWFAAADMSEMPDNADVGRVVELVRKDLLPLVEDDARRARFDALLGRLPEASKNGRGGFGFFSADDQGRVYAKSVVKRASADEARATYRALGDLVRAELAACTNADLAAAVDIPEGALKATVRVRPAVAAAAACAPCVAAKLEGADGDAQAAELAKAVDESMVKSASEGLAAFFGEEFGFSASFDGDVETCVCSAAGATFADRPAVSPDFGFEKLFFPDQTRTLAGAFDFASGIRAFAPAAEKAAAALQKSAAETGAAVAGETATSPVAEAVKKLPLPAGGAPFYFLYGKKDGAYTQTVAFPPAFIQAVTALASLAESAATGDWDDGDIDWDDDDDDVDFDEDDIEGETLEDEDFDDDEF